MRWGQVLRVRDDDDASVTSIELFFDLVYALAITQLTEYLLSNLTIAGAGRSLLLLLAVWWTWNYTAWFTNYFDPDRIAIRLVLMVLMLAGLAMSGSLPTAFDNNGLVFALSYISIQLFRTAFAVLALGRHALGPVFQRALVWWSSTSVLWLIGGLTHEGPQILLWTTAIAVDLLGMLIGFPVPAIGRSRTIDYTISGAHMAERCRLFILIALGESILITGQYFAEVLRTPAALAAFVTAFVSSVALWAVYFNRDAEAGSIAIAKAVDPGRLGVTAFGYFHVPILAGIVTVAAADKLTLAHPTDPATMTSAALSLGGPALFLAGSASYNWVIDRKAPVQRLVGLAGLALLIPVAPHSSQLDLLFAATAIILAIAVWDVVALRPAKRMG